MRLSAWGLRAQAFAGLMIINFTMRVFNPRTGACSFVLGYCLIPRYILSGCGHHLSHSGSVVARVRESGMPNGVSPGPWHFNGAVLWIQMNSTCGTAAVLRQAEPVHGQFVAESHPSRWRVAGVAGSIPATPQSLA